MKNFHFLLIAIFTIALVAFGSFAAHSQTGKPFAAQGVKLTKESKTDGVYVDAAGKTWPIYVKRIAVVALPNATSGTTAHGVTGIKLDGHLQIEELNAWSGSLGATARTNRQSTGVSFGFDATNVTITTTTNLSAQGGNILISYCKTSD